MRTGAVGEGRERFGSEIEYALIQMGGYFPEMGSTDRRPEAEGKKIRTLPDTGEKAKTRQREIIEAR